MEAIRALRRLAALVLVLPALLVQGCGFMAGAAVGAAGGYEAAEEGYEVRSPVTKDEDEDED